jgi:hypothetical protein
MKNINSNKIRKIIKFFIFLFNIIHPVFNLLLTIDNLVIFIYYFGKFVTFILLLVSKNYFNFINYLCDYLRFCWLY